MQLYQHSSAAWSLTDKFSMSKIIFVGLWGFKAIPLLRNHIPSLREQMLAVDTCCWYGQESTGNSRHMRIHGFVGGPPCQRATYMCFAPYTAANLKVDRLNSFLFKLICSEGLLIHLVECQPFQAFVYELDPHYILPTRHSLRQTKYACSIAALHILHRLGLTAKVM